ncbi:MAG: amidohydrolase family protein, partial [Candidatus Bathyarchaeia archaeon]
LNPLTKDADVLWKAANEFGISVMVHTGPGMHFALPSMVIPKAEDFPDVPIVLAHAGFGFFAAEALLLAQRYDNIYLEISWSPSYDVTAMVESVPDKVLFGTDLLENTPIELAKIKALNLAEDIRKKIFEENAIRVFKLRV